MNYPLSFSKLNMYRRCPLQFDVHNISNLYKFESNPQMDRGKNIHAEIDNYFKYRKALSELTYKHKVLLDSYLAMQGKKSTELKIAFSKSYTPCDFWDNEQASYRTAIDLQIHNEDKATIVDWKTGKPNQDVELEMLLFALAEFINYPEINKVRTVLEYLDTNERRIDVRHRADLADLIAIYEKEAQPLWDDLASGSFKPARNGLCTKYCKHFSECPIFR